MIPRLKNPPNKAQNIINNGAFFLNATLTQIRLIKPHNKYKYKYHI